MSRYFILICCNIFFGIWATAAENSSFLHGKKVSHNDASDASGLFLGRDSTIHIAHYPMSRPKPMAPPPMVCGTRFDSLSTVQNTDIQGRSSSVQSATGILGGERDVHFISSSPVSALGNFVNIGPSFLGSNYIEISNGPGAFSTLMIQWDGLDNDPVNVNPTGLGGINLAAQVDRISAILNADFGITPGDSLQIRFDIYSNAGAASRIVKNFKFANSTDNLVEFEFNKLIPFIGSGANLSSVGAVVLFIDMGVNSVSNRNGWDVLFKEITFDCPCPFPDSDVTQNCTGNPPNNDGRITITSINDSDRYGISTGSVYSGPNYASAIPIVILPFDAQTGIPNSGGTYTLRFFNGDNSCFLDKVITLAPLPITAANVASIGCHANGSPENGNDDFITFALRVQNTPTSIHTFTVSATQAGQPIPVVLSNGNPANQVVDDISTPLRTMPGTAGGGDILLTIINNVTSCESTVLVSDPGACEVICTPGAATTVSYNYTSQLEVTDLDDLPLIIPQFNPFGGSRILSSANLEYTIGAKTIGIMENGALSASTVSGVINSTVDIFNNGINIGTTTLNGTYPTTTIGPAVMVPAQSSWPGDVITGSSQSTLLAMPWISNYLHAFKTPVNDVRWVTNATGDATDDDDIHYLGVQETSSSGVLNFSAAPDLINFTGAGYVPLTLNTLSSFSLIGGGGNVTFNVGTSAFANVKVTYNYTCVDGCFYPISEFQVTNPTTSTPGMIQVLSSSGNRYGISVGTVYTGPDYAGATPMPGGFPAIIQNNINSTTSYTIRVFNNENGCFKDITVRAFICN